MKGTGLFKKLLGITGTLAVAALVLAGCASTATTETSTSESSSAAVPVVTQEDFVPEAVSSSSRKRALEIDSSDEAPGIKRSQGFL